MALTPGSVKRTDDSSGDDFLTFTTADAKEVQALALVDGSGAHTGIATSPLPVSGTVTVQDGGGAITVDGTVAVTNAGLTTLAGAVAGTEVQADIVAALPAGTNVIGATTDGGPSWTPAYQHTASADASSGADATAAPTTGQKIVVDDIIVSTGAALTVTFEEETSGTDLLILYMPANGIAQVTPRGRIKLPTADRKLRVKTSGAGNVACTVCYHSEA